MPSKIKVIIHSRNKGPQGPLRYRIVSAPKGTDQPSNAATRLLSYIQREQIPMDYIASEARVTPERLKMALTGEIPLESTLFLTLCKILKLDLDFFR